jgi:hypothetical protein
MAAVSSTLHRLGKREPGQPVIPAVKDRHLDWAGA